MKCQIQIHETAAPERANQVLVVLAVILNLLTLMVISQSDAAASPNEPIHPHIEQIDTFEVNGPRWIPDIHGEPGDTIQLQADQIIDIFVLGDGYFDEIGFHEYEQYIDRVKSWYNSVFDPTYGIRPFNLFPQAFRVHAIFEKSDERAGGPTDADRQSYYGVKLKGTYETIENDDDNDDGWWNQPDGVNGTFRSRFFQSINELLDSLDKVTSTLPVSMDSYPSDLDNSLGGDQVTEEMANRLKNVYAVIFVRRRSEACDDSLLLNDDEKRACVAHAGGIAPSIKHLTEDYYIRTAIGFSEAHEFSHAFGYLRDEYISSRDGVATYRNPREDEKSIFNLCNLTYSNDRCDLLWPHLAPGGKYNPDPRSFIGNLFKGGYDERNVWHSEYKCLMNGWHSNYVCYIDDVPEDADTLVGLRDYDHLCFWCEEIVAIHILERCHQFYEYGDPTEINALGREWFLRWKTELREKYYDYFNLTSLIEAKNHCWASYAAGNCDADCGDLCGGDYFPTCLSECDIREVGNAIYVNGTTGSDSNPGSKRYPIRGLMTAVNEATTACSAFSNPIIIVQPSTYTGTYTFQDEVTIITDDCGSVTIGD